MRILMLAQFYPPIVGGEENAVQALARALVERGHDVAVATLRHRDQPATSEDDGVEVHRVTSASARIGPLYVERRRHVPPAPDPELVWRLRKVATSFRPDVVHAHNWIVHSYAPIRKLRQAPLLLSMHDYSHICANKRLMRYDAPCSGPAVGKCARCAANHYDGVKGPVISAALGLSRRLSGAMIDHFVPVSAAVAERMRLADRGLPFTVIPNFVPDSVGRVAPATDAALPDGPFVLFLGDLSTDKGFDVLEGAYAEAGISEPLVALGRRVGAFEPRGGPGTRLLGMVSHEEALGAIRRCAVVVAPSRWHEPSGLVALEAMALGKPVIASRIGGLAETVVDGVTGVLVPPGDQPALAAALRRLLGDAALRERHGAAGRARVQADFSAAAVVPRIEALYGRVAAGASR